MYSPFGSQRSAQSLASNQDHIMKSKGVLMVLEVAKLAVNYESNGLGQVIVDPNSFSDLVSVITTVLNGLFYTDLEWTLWTKNDDDDEDDYDYDDEDDDDDSSSSSSSSSFYHYNDYCHFSGCVDDDDDGDDGDDDDDDDDVTTAAAAAAVTTAADDNKKEARL
ncbi:hypothetical protein PoB_006386800 [Plakobranchus ocellatus]|uniref:Uncharacterized protein n=1 Tax=Plakobranchus ocellatus TaxID=259542 RepID=A0AAV4CZK3_9GAST|nr:hypothetical protein PoB_006386800 [Plakobranchus ocellatus]